LDVDLEYPVHLCAGDPDHQGVQRIVLAALGAEPIRKAEEVLVVNRIQHHGSRPLDDLVFEGGDAPRIVHLMQFVFGMTGEDGPSLQPIFAGVDPHCH